MNSPLTSVILVLSTEIYRTLVSANAGIQGIPTTIWLSVNHKNHTESIGTPGFPFSRE